MSNEDLNGPIAFLQLTDFDDNGNVINQEIPKNKPIVIMLQASWCGHCKNAKPSFQNFANNNVDTVFCATVAADGTQPGEKELAQKFAGGIKGISVYGFPTYIGIKKNGDMVENSFGRDEQSLKAFADSLKA
jgi:thiol-disulfide isomerase/thioredoxin